MGKASATPKRQNASGERTREKILVAALTLFGERGPRGVGAREIAAAAGAPLAAIPYHFGTMEALYHAVLERVREQLTEAIGPAAQRARQALDASPEEAHAALLRLQGDLLDGIAGRTEAESWAKLLLREHLDPSSGFELVYEDAARDAIDLMAALIARATGGTPDDPAVLIRAFAHMGEVLIFRVTHHAVLRRLGWRDFGDEESRAIRQALDWA